MGRIPLAPAMAQDGISGGFSFELQSDSVISADSSESEETSTAITIEPGFSVQLPSGSSLNAGFVMEEWEFASEENEENVSEDYDFIVSELFVEWSGDGLSAHVGKINPASGVAWDVAPGIYGADLAGTTRLAVNWGQVSPCRSVGTKKGLH